MVYTRKRQEAYDNRETTDDHGMLIYGIAKDQEGNDYYMVKNSWGSWKIRRLMVRLKSIRSLQNHEYRSQ